jgi:hypothetical protein
MVPAVYQPPAVAAGTAVIYPSKKQQIVFYRNFGPNPAHGGSGIG